MDYKSYNSSYNNSSQPSENPDLEEAKALINLDYQKGLENRIQQLVKDTFGGHFDDIDLDNYVKNIQDELKEIEDLSFNCLIEDKFKGGKIWKI